MPTLTDRRPEVVVRFVRAGVYDDAGLAERARATLGEEERSALARLGAPEARRDYLAAHALARSMLARIAGCHVSRLRFRIGAQGRPDVAAPRSARRLSFSLSHADGIALCAVVPGVRVGADVESRRNVGPDPAGVASTVCSKSECLRLLNLPAGKRVDRFLALWTAKEAIAKAAGYGLRVPLGHLRVDRTSPWNVAVLRLTPDHLAAIAVGPGRRGAPAIRCEEERPSLRERPPYAPPFSVSA